MKKREGMGRGTMVRKVTVELILVAIFASLLLAAVALCAPVPGAGNGLYSSSPLHTRDFYSAEPGINMSRDRLSLYFHSDRPGGLGGNDLWVSERSALSEPWGPAKHLGFNINSTADESGPVLSRDALRLYFISNRLGGFGGADLWVSRRQNPRDNLGWQPPVNLGSQVNSLFEESSFTLHEDENSDGVIIYFSSNRPGGAGSNNLFAAALQPDGKFAAATPVIEPTSPFAGQPPAAGSNCPDIAPAPEFAVVPRSVPHALPKDAWAPPDLDEDVPHVAPRANCALPAVLKAAGARLVELLANLEKFTATERIEYAEVTRKGAAIQRKAREFNYVVSLQEIRPGMLAVDEYRNGDSGSQLFFGNMATNGLPALVLIFHPYYAGDFEMKCEGLGEIHGEPAWQIYFRQRADRPSRMSRLHVGFKSYPMDLRGRAWISARTSQVVRLEADVLNPAKETRMERSHKIVEYQQVRFEKSKVALWLPARAEVFMHFRGHRYQIRHSFSDFLLFGVEVKHEISTSTERKPE
jgi:hypothetical protein